MQVVEIVESDGSDNAGMVGEGERSIYDAHLKYAHTKKWPTNKWISEFNC